MYNCTYCLPTYKSNSCIIHTHFTLGGYSSRNIPNFRKCVYFYILPEYTGTYCLPSLCKRSNRKSNSKDVNFAI